MRVYGRGLKKAPRPTGALASCATAAEDVRPNYGIDTTLGMLYAVSCGAKKAVMTTITATEARKLLYKLLDEATLPSAIAPRVEPDYCALNDAFRLATNAPMPALWSSVAKRTANIEAS